MSKIHEAGSEPEIITFLTKSSDDKNSVKTSGAVTKIIKRCGIGDNKAENELFTLTMKELRKTATKLINQFPPVRAKLTPEDLVGIIYKKLFRLLSDKKIKNSKHFFALAFKNFRWAVLDTLRKAESKVDSGADVGKLGKSQPGIGTRIANKEENKNIVECMMEAVKCLPPRGRDVLERHLWLKMTFADIAKELKESPNTVASRYRQALIKVVDKVRKLFPDNTRIARAMKPMKQSREEVDDEEL